MTLTERNHHEKRRCFLSRRLPGMKSVPALVLDGDVFHIHFGAPMSASTGA
ncbi:MAG: hypothetical protein QM749_18555 [Aquabacterium sp.]